MLDLVAVQAQRVAEAQPELDVVLFPVLLVPQVVEQELANRRFLAAVMDAAEEGGICLLEVEVLRGVAFQRLDGEIPRRPRLVEGVRKEAPVLDYAVYGLYDGCGHVCFLLAVTAPRERVR